MARFGKHVLVAVLGALASNAWAQPPADIPLLRQYTQSNPPFLRFRVVDGKVALSCRSPAIFQTPRAVNMGRQESIRVGNENGRATLRYERKTPSEQFLVDVGGSNSKVTISRKPSGSSKLTAVEFRQTPSETTLTLGSGEKRQVFSAANLWQLAIVRRKECREQLFPLLDLLRSDWKTATMADRIEAALLARGRENVAEDRGRWAALVAQLGDDEFTKREAADRTLRAGGASALRYLRELDMSKLDAEQQLRVRRIVRKLSGHSEDDTVESVASALAKDAGVWLALLGRPEKAARETAAKQLTVLLGKPIDTDPAAEPSTQEAKRERLRAMIEKK